MASHEFGRAFGINNNVKPLQSLPATVQRRKDKLPRTPTSRAAPESTETPYTSDDTYNNEPNTPTMTRKQQPQPQPQPSQAPMPSLIDTLIAQNQRAEESSKRAEKSNRQIMQTLMQTMERLAQPQPQPQLPSQPPQPTYLPPQPIANLYDTTIQQTKQLSEKSKLVRPSYVKVRLTNSRDWAK
jgi:hypothetical protein